MLNTVSVPLGETTSVRVLTFSISKIKHKDVHRACTAVHFPHTARRIKIVDTENVPLGETTPGKYRPFMSKISGTGFGKV
jgi:hypothetical protein